MITSVVDKLSHGEAVILTSCCLSLLIVSMDATIVNVAIPSIRSTWRNALPDAMGHRHLHPGAGLAADPRRRCGRPLRPQADLQIGLGIFAFGSLLCSIAPDIDTLIAARLVQAWADR